MPDPFTDKDRARLWFLARHTEAVTPGCLPTRVVAYIERLEADLDHSERALEREAQRRVAAEIESEMARAALKGEDG